MINDYMYIRLIVFLHLGSSSYVTETRFCKQFGVLNHMNCQETSLFDLILSPLLKRYLKFPYGPDIAPQ